MPRTYALAVFLFSTLAFAAPQPPLLPHGFANWTASATPPAMAAPGSSEAAALQEYGLKQTAAASYVSGRAQLDVRAWRFGDATGAYGAFTWYRKPEMHPENLGRAGASAGHHFVFWNGATVVDASFTGTPSDEKAAVAALAAQLPQPPGPEGVPPSLPHYLPPAQLHASTVRYAIGPSAYTSTGGVLPPNIIDFSQDAEAVTANYGPAAGQGTLTLLMYPTPQIAAAHLRSIEAFTRSSGMTARRTGPLVAIVSGNSAGAQKLLDQVHFNDYVTVNHPEGYVPEAVKVSRLLLGIAALTGILLGGALLLGIFLGGGRALLRLIRGKPASTVSDEEFISLHLES